MATHSCSCLENPRDGGNLVGCRLWGRTESDTTEATQQQQMTDIFKLEKLESSLNQENRMCRNH